jgi:hypothetical protein
MPKASLAGGVTPGNCGDCPIDIIFDGQKPLQTYTDQSDSVNRVDFQLGVEVKSTFLMLFQNHGSRDALS